VSTGHFRRTHRPSRRVLKSAPQAVPWARDHYRTMLGDMVVDYLTA
jgi:hypothetical protein